MTVTAACSRNDTASPANTSPTGPTSADTTPAATTATSTVTLTDDAEPIVLDAEAPKLGRVVSLAEEFILADLLALGIEPVASTATVDAVGFQGLDGFDTSAIEVLPQTTLSLEYLASLQPDTMVTSQFWIDQVGADVLQGIADVVVIPDGLSGAERIQALGELVGRPEQAAQVARDVAAAQATAAEQVGGDCRVSLATIYPGPTVAAFVDGPSELPSAFESVGCELVPGPEVAPPDGNGRAWLSEEQLGLLDGPTLVLMQNDSVDGESDALAAITSSAIWRTLPAVAADGVVVVDRLGYPGAQGLIRFYGEVARIVAATGE
jgi:iron complex transport system substrate-binding protein